MSISPEWVSAISTVVLVGATIIYVYYSNKLVKETTKLREVETTPFISVYLQSFKKSPYMEIIVENIGKAPAYNVRIDFDGNLKEFIKKEKVLLPDYLDITYFSPSQKVSYFLGKYENLTKNNNKSFIFSMTYFSKDGRKFSDNIEYSYEFLARSDNSIPYEMEKYKQIIKSLAKSLDKSLEKTTNKIISAIIKDNDDERI